MHPGVSAWRQLGFARLYEPELTLGYKNNTTPLSPAKPLNSTSLPCSSCSFRLGRVSPSFKTPPDGASGEAAAGASASFSLFEAEASPLVSALFPFAPSAASFVSASPASGSSSIFSSAGFDLVDREAFEVELVVVFCFFEAGPDLGAEADRWDQLLTRDFTSLVVGPNCDHWAERWMHIRVKVHLFAKGQSERFRCTLTFFPSAAAEGGAADPAIRALRRDAVLSGAADCCWDFERGGMVSTRYVSRMGEVSC